MKIDDAVADIRKRLENGRPIPRITVRSLLLGYEAAMKDLGIANKCVTCIYNTGAEGEFLCKSRDKTIRFINRKEDRYIRAACCGWEWRGPVHRERQPVGNPDTLNHNM